MHYIIANAYLCPVKLIYRIKRNTLFLTAGLFLSTTIAHTQTATDKKLTAEFDKVLAAEIQPNEPGFTAIVAKKGQIIYKKAIGMANLEQNISLKPESVFRIGSVTKQFTAVAILQLMEQGKLHLQDDITQFIPDYPTQGHTITIEHLLTHTSGIQSFTSMKDYTDRMALDVTPTEMIDHFKNEPMHFAPGTKFEYCNSGYFILAHIIEKITGKSYREYVEENFFKPLGMTNSLYGSNVRLVQNRAGTYSKPTTGYENASQLSMTQPFGAGSIMSTVEDLYKWNAALQAGKVIKKETLQKAQTSYKLTDGSETGYGYGWSFGGVQGSPTIEHGGGINGTLTMGIYLPNEDVFVAVFSNCDCHDPGQVAAKLAALMLGKPYAFKEIKMEPSALQEYTGVYENAKGELRTISVSENNLYSQRGRYQKFILKAYEKDKFFFDDQVVTMGFERNAKGEVDKLILQTRKGNEEWNRSTKTMTEKPEVKVDEKILDTYVGKYEVNAEFNFVVTKEKNQLFVQATGQQKLELFAETETKFFLKIVDAQLEFMKDGLGNVGKVVLYQNGQTVEAKRVN